MSGSQPSPLRRDRTRLQEVFTNSLEGPRISVSVPIWVATMYHNRRADSLPFGAAAPFSSSEPTKSEPPAEPSPGRSVPTSNDLEVPMRTIAATFALLLSASAAAWAGDLIPTDRRFGPLRVASHKVEVTVDNQIAMTRVEQIFANDHPATLEAHYLFPVPK